MKTGLKKSIFFIICLIMLFGVIGIGSQTVSADNPTSGTCGDNLTWEYAEISQTLTISGTGEMSSYTRPTPSPYYITTAPWKSFCETMKYVVIKSGVTSIGGGAFSGCTGLTSVTIGNSVTSIGGSAFYGCTGFTSITIPENVTNIGNGAFSGCTGLTSVTIGNGVTSIGNGAFYGCTGLTEINYNAVNAALTSSSNVFYNVGTAGSGVDVIFGNSVEKIPACLFYVSDSNKPNIISVTIGNNVTSIGNSAFYNCSSLTSITIPESVTSIDNSAFYGCTGLTSVTIGNSVTSIGGSAFSGCRGLNAVNISNIAAWCNITFNGQNSNPLNYAKHLYMNNSEITDLIIPDSVTAIGSYVFYNCTGLTSITIPDSVTSIGGYAFSGCTGLTSVTIPDSVVEIGMGAFEGCNGLTEITIPFIGYTRDPNGGYRSVFGYIFGYECTTGPYSDLAYNNNGKIPQFSVFARYETFENEDGGTYNVSYYDKYSYYIPSSLRKVTVTNTDSVPNNAFINCSFLTEINLPPTINTIGNSAFNDCSGLISITIPDSVTSLGNSAFSGCTGFTSITIPDSVTSIGYYAFGACEILTTVTLENGIENIGDSAFKDCPCLESIIIPDSVTSIGQDAFKGIPNVIYNGTASGSPWGAMVVNGYVEGKLIYSDSQKEELVVCLSSASGEIIIPDSVVSIGNSAFSDCYDITDIVIPSSVTLIGKSAFENCTGLTHLIIPDSVTTIEQGALKGCDNLEELTIPFTGSSRTATAYNGVFGFIFGYYYESEIAYGNTSQGSSTTFIDKNYGTVHYDNSTWQYSCKDYHFVSNFYLHRSLYFYIPLSLRKVTVTDAEKIDVAAFMNCEYIAEIILNEGISLIGDYAFRASGISGIVIPDSVTSIGNKAFDNCLLETVKMGSGLTDIPSTLIHKDSLKTFVIGKNVTNIGYATFSGCTALSSVTIGNSVKSIGGSAFSGCTGLTSITIPNSVTSIGYSAFLNCSGLTSITIPDSVTNIDYDAFNGCPLEYVKMGNGLTSIPSTLINKDSLKTFIIGNGVTNTGNSTFSGCTKLSSVTIPDSVVKIDYASFSGCVGLTSIVIPSSVTSITSSAFSGCTGITSITIPDSVTNIAYDAFNGCPLEYVKMGSGLTTIPSTLIHKDSLKTFIIGENVTTVSGFSGCTWLTSITIPNSVTSIGYSAFSNCSGLTNVNIGTGVKTINDSVFSGCTSLATIALPSGITKIGNGAFSNTAYYNNASNWSDNMLYIGNYLIKGKTDLAYNQSVKSDTLCIADYAFSGCNKIITLTVPVSVNYIGDNAFGNVTNVAYTGTATGSPWGAKCLNGYADGNFIFKDSAKKKLISCCGLATGSVEIPSSTDTIGDYAFNQCNALTAVYIPINVTRIGTNAFQNTSLTDIYYEGSTIDKLGMSIADNNSNVTDATWHYGSRLSDMPVNVVHTLSFDANGGSNAPSNQVGSGYVSITNSAPSRNGYTFLGWSTDSNATSATYGASSLINLDRDTVLYAVWRKDETQDDTNNQNNPDNPTNPTNPTNDNSSNPDNPSNPTNPDNPTNPSNPDNPSQPSTDIPEANIIYGNSADNKKTYNYKTTVTFTAVVPEGGSVQWYVDGKPAGNGNTLTVKDKTNDYTVKVVVTDKNGNQTMDEEQVTIKHGFFDILIWFFVHLFNPAAYDVKQ